MERIVTTSIDAEVWIPESVVNGSTSQTLAEFINEAEDDLLADYNVDGVAVEVESLDRHRFVGPDEKGGEVWAWRCRITLETLVDD